MSLNMTGKNLDLTEAMQEYITEKVNMLYNHVDNITQIDVEVDKNTHHNKGEDVFHVRINVQVPQELLHVEKEEGDFHAAVDAAKDTMDRQLRQYKEKFETKKHKAWKEQREMKTAQMPAE